MIGNLEHQSDAILNISTVRMSAVELSNLDLVTSTKYKPLS